mmetsp:Transcript_127157/g.245213  ORF Transcript_127157/g.245213 Transcript_127157/m.245213 type:complete len:246 (-) Transcript_127157:427-1164(-)
MRVLSDQGINCIGSTDKSKAIHQTSFHDWPQRLPSSASDKIDNAWGKRSSKSIGSENMGQATNCRQFQNNGVSHEQRRNHHCIHLVQWVVVRSSHQGHANWTTPNPPTYTADCCPISKLFHAVALLQGINDCFYELHCAVKLRGGICGVFTDLPHKNRYDGLTCWPQQLHEAFDSCDSSSQRFLRPLALTTVPSCSCCFDRLCCLCLRQGRNVPNHSSVPSCWINDGAGNFCNITCPRSLLTLYK